MAKPRRVANNRAKLVGKTFGKLKVISYSHTIGKTAFWECLCDCGNTNTIRSHSIISGRTKSCGCLKNIGGNIRHGLRYSKEYKIWQCIMTRVRNPNRKDAYNYIDRGITACEKWKHFTGFYEDMGDIPEGKTQIDRIDNNKGYYKENCRWVTKTENVRNRRVTLHCEWEGKIMKFIEAVELSGYEYSVLWRKLTSEGKIIRNPDISLNK